MERRLLDATERLMRDGASFTELSVDRLSSEAGISRASFYIYFEDKGHLLRRLAGQVFADLADSADRWWSVAWRHDPEDVRAATTGHRRRLPASSTGARRAERDGRLRPPGRSDLSQSADRHHRASDPCHRGRPGRRLHPPRAAYETTASALTWMVERACQQNLPTAPDSYDAELAESLAQIIWGALYLKPISVSG